eukprot:10552908-Karenia_brevis.AAC.1
MAPVFKKTAQARNGSAKGKGKGKGKIAEAPEAGEIRMPGEACKKEMFQRIWAKIKDSPTQWET